MATEFGYAGKILKVDLLSTSTSDTLIKSLLDGVPNSPLAFSSVFFCLPKES